MAKMGQRHNSAAPNHPHITKRGGSPKNEDAAGRADTRVNQEENV